MAQTNRSLTIKQLTIGIEGQKPNTQKQAIYILIFYTLVIICLKISYMIMNS